jgi:ABC-type sugar transport system ATPase subunit
VVLISHDMPHVFELADRIHIIMTGATPSELDQTLTKKGNAE